MTADYKCKWFLGGHSWYSWNDKKDVCRRCGAMRIAG